MADFFAKLLKMSYPIEQLFWIFNQYVLTLNWMQSKL